jgi:tripartite-type tricarboxylate transporter receptor subunit TctC
MKDVQEQLAKLSIEGVPSTPEELMQRLKDDAANLNMVVDKAGIVRK